MFVGTVDTLADKEDAEWTRDTLGDNMIHYQMIDGGHMTFLIGKDMSYFTEDVMMLLQEYQPLSSENYTQ